MSRLVRLLFAALVAGGLSATSALAEPLVLVIAKAESGFDARTGQPVLTLSLTPASAKAFGQLTAENVGKTVELRIDGEVVMAPRVVEPILGGSVQVSGSFQGPELKTIADRIASGDARVEVEVIAE